MFAALLAGSHCAETGVMPKASLKGVEPMEQENVTTAGGCL